MTLAQPARYALGLALTAVAGWLAAVGFLEFSGLYVSFISGNTIQVGLNVERQQWPLLTRSLTALGMFVFGAWCGGMVTPPAGRWVTVVMLAIETCALAIGAALLAWHPDWQHGLIAALTFAMGVQNHIVAKSRPDGAGTTFVTGTLFRAGDALARHMLGRDRSGLWLFSLVVGISFALGAGLGAYAETWLGRSALFPVVALVAALTLIALAAEVFAGTRPAE